MRPVFELSEIAVSSIESQFRQSVDGNNCVIYDITHIYQKFVIDKLKNFVGGTTSKMVSPISLAVELR